MSKKKSKAKSRELEARRRKNRRARNGTIPEAGVQPAPLQKEHAAPLAAPESAPLAATSSGAPPAGPERSASAAPVAVLDPSAPAAGGEKKKPRRTPRPWRTQVWVWDILFFLTPLVLLFCAQAVTLQSGADAMEWIGGHPGAAVFTYVLLLALQLLLLAMTGGLIWSSVICTVVVMGFSLANYFKQAINGVPLLPSDLAMAGQVGDIAGFLRPGMTLGEGTWLALGLLAGLLLLTALFAVKPRARKGRWYIRVIAALAAVLVLLGVDHIPPVRSFIVDGPKDEVQAQRNERLGLLAGLYGGFLESSVQPPDAYNENNMNALLNSIKARASHPADAGVQPNVVLLMSESFCDPTAILPNVEFDEDPIPNYRALAQEWPSGGFLSNTYAGGTGSVELEVLTGIPNGFVGEGVDLTSLPEEEMYDRMPSIVRTFAGGGYATEFVHSYTDKLFNRAVNLPLVGYEQVLFDTAFPADAEREGPYLSDMALTDKLITEFEARDENKPLFLFGLSMENHQPYFNGKFPDASGVDYSAPSLNTEDAGALDALIKGVHDADAALAALLDYFETCGEPVIVVFWGDHLPSLYLGDDGTLYSRLGYTDTADTLQWSSDVMKQMHTTRFLVWNNYGADLSAPDMVGCSQLGSRILDWAGVPKPLYFHWVDQTMDQMLLYRERLFIAADGTPYKSPPESNARMMENYRNIVYDILYGEGYIANALTELPTQKK